MRTATVQTSQRIRAGLAEPIGQGKISAKEVDMWPPKGARQAHGNVYLMQSPKNLFPATRPSVCHIRSLYTFGDRKPLR